MICWFRAATETLGAKPFAAFIGRRDNFGGTMHATDGYFATPTGSFDEADPHEVTVPNL